MTAKGVAVKLKSYEETIPKVLDLIKLQDEIKKYDKIVLKPNLIPDFPEISTKPEFIETILKFCITNKNPASEIFIAEGCDGADTNDIFDDFGYTKLAEKYGVGLVDLNNAETSEITNSDFLRFDTINYPKILLDSFVISAPQLGNHNEIGIAASLDNMLGTFPSKHYKGFFSKTKNKLSKYALEHQIHDIVKCKMPNLAVIDANEENTILVGQPLEMDKQSAKLKGVNWKEVTHLNLIDGSQNSKKDESDSFKEEIDNIIN